MFTSDNPIEQTSELLESAKDYITKTILKDHPSILLMVTASLTKTINQLNFMTGKQTVSNQIADLPPITNFMGEEIIYSKKITPADMTPLEADRAAYLNKVSQLYDQIITIDPEGVIAGYTLPEDHLVIRGVAKRAGLEDYEDRDIDTDFIEDIQEAIKKAAATDANQLEIDRKLAAGEVITKPPVDTDEDEEEEEEDPEGPAASDANQLENNGTTPPPETSSTNASSIGKGNKGKKG